MTDLITPDTLATAAAIPVVKKALDGLAATVRRGAGAIAKRVLDRAIANLQIGFAPYLQTSYGRCRLVKTLLSQDRPLALLDIYINLLLACKDQYFIDDDLIADLDSYRRVVITGLAGSGKSMFMKYLTVCRFENSRGTIPLFVELRQLNSHHAGVIRVDALYWLWKPAFQKVRLIFKLYQYKNPEDVGDYLKFERTIKESLENRSITHTSTITEAKEAVAFLGEVYSSEEMQQDASGSDAVLMIMMKPEILARAEFTQTAGEVIQNLRSIRKVIQERLGGQDSIVELLCREAVPVPNTRARPRRRQKA
jgi:hypothetical protein